MVSLRGRSVVDSAEVLVFEADRRSFIIPMNSFGTQLSKEDRAEPWMGRW